MKGLDKIKKSLEEISKWPWENTHIFHNEEVITRFDTKTGEMRKIGVFVGSKINADFMSQSPETISTLVELVEKSVEMANVYSGISFSFGREEMTRINRADEYLALVKEKLDD